MTFKFSSLTQVSYFKYKKCDTFISVKYVIHEKSKMRKKNKKQNNAYLLLVTW